MHALNDLLPIEPPDGWSRPADEPFNWTPWLVGGCAVAGLVLLMKALRPAGTGSALSGTCSESRAGGTFRKSCFDDTGSVTGFVDTGLVKPCGVVRKFSKYGLPRGEDKQCFWKARDAESFVKERVN